MSAVRAASKAKPKPPQPELAGAGSRVKRRNYGKGHGYTIDGVKADGVTTLIGEGIPKPALINWAANTTAGYAVDHWDELGELPVSKRLDVLKGARYADVDQAAQKGTAVHELAERILHGEEVQVPDELAPYVNNAVRFLDEWKIRPILSETVVYSLRGKYAGTLDMVVTSDLLPGKVILADWKTSRSGIYGEAALQLSAYANSDFYVDANGVDQPTSALGITDHWGIWVRPDGYDVLPLDNSAETFRTFQYAATVARRARGLMELRGSALVRPDVAS
ncbi:MAG TPA: hypothetical protein VJZ25_06380 [Gemmatimonadaceae bacterium]|nr:hypothetical protein [Gemmatimonadaceae bacterium]